MTEILSTVLAGLALLGALGTVALWARGDRYAAPGIGHRDADPLNKHADLPPEQRRLQPGGQRTRTRAIAERRPATYESQATTATA
jgi:hypothetical protein